MRLPAASAGLGGSVKIVRGGGREQTFNRFASAVASGRAGAPVLLLVDSEDPVAPGSSVWQHLHDRDGWTRPDGAGDDQVFLMVQLMETWFLADRDALRRYFGAQFRENAVRQWPVLEAVPKATGSLETRDAVLRVADRLRASFGSTLWHLKNLRYIDEVTRERIENEPQQQPA